LISGLFKHLRETQLTQERKKLSLYPSSEDINQKATTEADDSIKTSGL